MACAGCALVTLFFVFRRHMQENLHHTTHQSHLAGVQKNRNVSETSSSYVKNSMIDSLSASVPYSTGLSGNIVLYCNYLELPFRDPNPNAPGAARHSRRSLSRQVSGSLAQTLRRSTERQAAATVVVDAMIMSCRQGTLIMAKCGYCHLAMPCHAMPERGCLPCACISTESGRRALSAYGLTIMFLDAILVLRVLSLLPLNMPISSLFF